jgi:hypothetical protein
MGETTSSPEDKAFERQEHVLQVYYERLNNMDKSNQGFARFASTQPSWSQLGH